MSNLPPLKEALQLYAILDPAITPHTLPYLINSLIKGGVRCFQYRDKVNTDTILFENAKSVANICRKHGAYFFINDRVDIAMMVGANGVHLGPDDLPIEAVRRFAPNLLIGASSGNLERALELEKQGADYLGIGAIFDAKATKPNASNPRGLEIIRTISNNINIPFVAIGGINMNNAASVFDAGADGIAMLRSLTNTKNPKLAAESFIAYNA